MKRFFKQHGLALVVICFFVALGGIGIYNSTNFRAKCKALGGVVVAYETACVKPDSMIQVPR